MSEIRFRLAKPCDAKQIANVHYHVRDKYGEGFFAHVNKAFLRQYYKVILNDPYQVVVCAEQNGKILGFCSGSLDASKEFQNIRKNKWKFLIPLITTAMSNLSIIKDAYIRFKSTDANSKVKYINTSGPRCEYWAWLPERDDSYMSLYVQELVLYFMKCFGINEVYGEGDLVNEKVMKLQLRNGTKILEKFIMPDGRERIKTVINLNEHKFKLYY